jgi:hypothetical protein
VLKAAAASTASLQEAETVLAQAISIAQQLSHEEGGLLVESNKGCAAELEAADAARSALAMLLCQGGCDAEAAPHLKALGFKYRLSREVRRMCHHAQLANVWVQVPLPCLDTALCLLGVPPLLAALTLNAARCCVTATVSRTSLLAQLAVTICDLCVHRCRWCVQVLQYAVPKPRSASAAPSPDAVIEDGEQDGTAIGSSTCSFMQAVDEALPPALLQHLQHVFSPGADFWRQHAYGRVGYFSYFFQLVRTE